MKKSKTAFIKLLFYNFIIVIFLLVLCEISVRIIYPQIEPTGIDRTIMKDKRYYNSAGLIPFSKGYANGKLIEVDEFGFRKTSVKIDTSKKSILFLGDSITMGMGVEADSSFHGIIQSKLKDVNILNPSLIGYSISDYQNLMNYYLSKNDLYKIDKVIVCFCLNDIYAGKVDQVQVPGGNLRDRFTSLVNFLRSNSRLFLFIKKSFSDRPKDYFMFDEKYYDQNNEAFKSSINIISEMKNKLNENNIELTFVIFPYEYQLRSNNYNPQKVLLDELNKMKIKSVSLKFDIQRYNSEDFYLYGDGIHFNNFGHKLAADFLIDAGLSQQ